jgi:hypothetical protein
MPRQRRAGQGQLRPDDRPRGGGKAHHPGKPPAGILPDHAVPPHELDPGPELVAGLDPGHRGQGLDLGAQRVRNGVAAVPIRELGAQHHDDPGPVFGGQRPAALHYPPARRLGGDVDQRIDGRHDGPTAKGAPKGAESQLTPGQPSSRLASDLPPPGLPVVARRIGRPGRPAPLLGLAHLGPAHELPVAPPPGHRHASGPRLRLRPSIEERARALRDRDDRGRRVPVQARHLAGSRLPHHLRGRLVRAPPAVRTEPGDPPGEAPLAACARGGERRVAPSGGARREGKRLDRLVPQRHPHPQAPDAPSTRRIQPRLRRAVTRHARVRHDPRRPEPRFELDLAPARAGGPFGVRGPAGKSAPVRQRKPSDGGRAGRGHRLGLERRPVGPLVPPGLQGEGAVALADLPRKRSRVPAAPEGSRVPTGADPRAEKTPEPDRSPPRRTRLGAERGPGWGARRPGLRDRRAAPGQQDPRSHGQ